MRKIPVILGPTAVGKSELTLQLAKEIGGEIVSCDSRQVYRMMNVGTAKPSAAECKEVTHHIVDIVDPSFEFSAAEWSRRAEAAIEEIQSRGNLPLVCGGTFFYYQVLSEGLSHSFPADYGFRKEMLSKEKETPGVLHQLLCEQDALKAEQIHANDHYRLIRALQNIRDREKGALEHLPNNTAQYHFIPIVLERERSLLYHRINQRVDEMMKRGLYEEFQSLLEAGYSEETPGLKCVGYREFFNYIDSQSSLDITVEKIKQNTRKFAKRQLTWLRNKIQAELKIDLNSYDKDKSISTIMALLDR